MVLMNTYIPTMMISFQTLDLDLRRVQFKSIFKLVSSYHKEHIMLFKSTVIFSLIQTTLRQISVVINYLSDDGQTATFKKKYVSPQKQISFIQRGQRWGKSLMSTQTLMLPNLMVKKEWYELIIHVQAVPRKTMRKWYH